MKRILYFLPLLLIFNCQKKDIKIVKNFADTLRVKPKIKKKELLPNDEFREKVLPYLKNNSGKEKLAKILKVLDSKNISFCEYVKKEFQFDDSCYALAKKKFPEPTMQKSFTKFHDKIFDKAHLKLVKKYDLSEKDAELLTTIYAFDSNSRELCGNY
jgi:hypothetical protein